MKSKLLVVISVLGLLAGMESAKAQAVLSGAGGIDLKGGSSFSPASQSGIANRFLWLPDKAALVVGSFSSTPSTSLIGNFSFALGNDARAPGLDSISLGLNTIAQGDDSVALGNYASAYGAGAVAVGGGAAYGNNSAAIGPALAFGYGSIALGFSITGGEHSVAMGEMTYSGSWSGTVVGSGNLNVKKDGVSVPDPEIPASDDPIFEVGNGYVGSPVEENDPWFGNALTVFRDGTIRMSKASGGISMGQFGN